MIVQVQICQQIFLNLNFVQIMIVFSNRFCIWYIFYLTCAGQQQSVSCVERAWVFHMMKITRCQISNRFHSMYSTAGKSKLAIHKY